MQEAYTEIDIRQWRGGLDARLNYLCCCCYFASNTFRGVLLGKFSGLHFFISTIGLLVSVCQVILGIK